MKPKEIQSTLNLRRTSHMIKWDPLFERHVLGRCHRGQVWIRLGRDEKVTGVYLMFHSVEKLVPRTGQEETLAGAKQLAEDELQLMDWAEELAQKNN